MTEINKKLAHIFEEMGIIYEIKDDKYRQRAYYNGAEILNTMSEDVEILYKKEGILALVKLPRIGRGMAEKIEEFIKTNHIKEYDNLKKEFPIKLEELTLVEGVGPKMIKVLYKELNIKNLNDLESAAQKEKIRILEGFGEKTEKNILQAIAFLRQETGRMLLGDALPYAREFIEKLKKIEGVEIVSEAGSLRRRKETIGDIDILVASNKPNLVLQKIEKMKGVQKIWGKGETKISVHIEQGFDIDVRAVKEENYGAALQYFTGSKEHNIKLRQIAIDKGYKLNEYGLFQIQKSSPEANQPSTEKLLPASRFKSGQAGKTQNHNSKFKSNEKFVAGRTEKEIYSKLGLEVMPPELRENIGETEAAQKGKLPKLINYGDLKGDLQIQTNWTDGKNSIEEMALAAKEHGLEYILITDHTKRLAMTGGLNDKKVLEQKKEIEKLNTEYRRTRAKLGSRHGSIQNSEFRILSGAEVDILKDGSLDLDDKTLAQLDIVGASVHSYFKLSKHEQTKRVIKAIQNPNIDILFHPTGRRINRRAAIELDIEEIIKTVKETGTILEINSSPARLDLKDEYIKMALSYGCKFAINSDAHSKTHYRFLEFGIAQARRGWVEAEDVINTYPLEEMLASLK